VGIWVCIMKGHYRVRQSLEKLGNVNACQRHVFETRQTEVTVAGRDNMVAGSVFNHRSVP
jgi:hypothetical protein